MMSDCKIEPCPVCGTTMTVMIQTSFCPECEKGIAPKKESESHSMIRRSMEIDVYNHLKWVPHATAVAIATTTGIRTNEVITILHKLWRKGVIGRAWHKDSILWRTV